MCLSIFDATSWEFAVAAAGRMEKCDLVPLVDDYDTNSGSFVVIGLHTSVVTMGRMAQLRTYFLVAGADNEAML